MLKQAAAKASTKAVNQNVGTLGHPFQTRPTADLPMTIEGILIIPNTFIIILRILFVYLLSPKDLNKMFAFHSLF